MTEVYTEVYTCVQRGDRRSLERPRGSVMSRGGLGRPLHEVVDAVLPHLAKSQTFIERQRRIEHLDMNADPLPATRAFGQDVLEDGAADTGAPVFRQQRDVDDSDLALPAG